jgi:hypothetical protein
MVNTPVITSTPAAAEQAQITVSMPFRVRGEVVSVTPFDFLEWDMWLVTTEQVYLLSKEEYAQLVA